MSCRLDIAHYRELLQATKRSGYDWASFDRHPRPGDLFLRLRLLRRIILRSGDDPLALSGLARIYLDAGVRLEEAERVAGRLAALQRGPESEALLRAAKEKRKGSGG